MDRLIVKDKQGGWHLKGVPWSRLHPGQVITPDIYGRLYNALCRLAEYEDTGMEPRGIIDGAMREEDQP